MKNIITIFNREIRAYFNSAIAYIFITVFFLISVGLFMAQFFLISNADMRSFFYTLPVILCVFLPAVAMRLWAEDRKGNTLELLLTFPIKTYELVLGKFCASFLFYTISLLATVTVPIVIAILGDPDFGVIICQYLGAILVGSFFLALGIFVSGFCKDQIVSFIVAMMACFIFFILGTDFTVSSIDGWIPGLGSFLRNSIGMPQHFAGFQKGVIDNRDLLYFIIGTIVFLTLNGFWLEMRLRPKAKTIFTITCCISIVIFTLINFIVNDIPIGRFDCTEGKIYTISKPTHKILQDLKAPVLVKLFISPSDKMPSRMKTLERDIRDKLDEFKVAAKGRFDYKVFHLEAAKVSKEDEQSLEGSIQRKGIRPFQVQSVEADEVGVKLIYSAMSIAYKEKPEEVVPQITSLNMLDLEYTLISRIRKMALTHAPSVALFTSSEKEKNDYDLMQRLLEYEGYKVTHIKLTRNEPIPEDTDTLIVIGPKELNERQRFEINRFLVNGGSVFLAIQENEFDYSSFGPQGIRVRSRDINPQINQLIENWGLKVNKDFLMDTQIDVVSLTGGKLYGVFEISSPVKLPVQLKIVSEQMNPEISITSRLSILLYLWGSAIDMDIEKLKEMGLAARVLFTSSPNAWEVPYHSGDLKQEDLVVPFPDKCKIFPLGLLMEGQFLDAFKGREVPAWPKDEKETDESYERPQEKAELSPTPGKLILLGCAKMFENELFDKGGHMTFFLNSIDSITLGEELISVRSKQQIARTLGSISSGAKVWWRVFTTFLVPAGLCIIGGVRLFIRKRSKWVYLKTI